MDECLEIWLLIILCFIDMEGTYAEYSDWADDGVPDMVTHQYRRALQQMEKCKPYEEAMVTAHFCHSCSFIRGLIYIFHYLQLNYISGGYCGSKGSDCDVKLHLLQLSDSILFTANIKVTLSVIRRPVLYKPTPISAFSI